MNNYEKNVKKGIRNAVDVVIPGMRISGKALKLISSSLYGLNEKLVSQCLKVRFPKRQDAMPVNAAKNAVDKVFTGEMRKFAESAAHKNIAKYNFGLLVYKPQDRAAKKTKSKFQAVPEFVKVVPVIAQLVHPQASVQTDAKTLLAMILQRMCAKIIEKSHETAKGKKSLDTKDIIKAVDGFMAATMAKHAISEGARNCVMFTSGSTKLKLGDFKANVKRKAKDQLYPLREKHLK